MDAPERFEQLIAFLNSQLPAPVSEEGGAGGAIVFTAGEPPEVVVQLTASSVIVSEFAVQTRLTPMSMLGSAHLNAVPRPRRVGALNWKRLPENALLSALTALVRGAAQSRRATYRTCQVCEALTPPEWMYNDEVCHRCSEREQAVH